MTEHEPATNPTSRRRLFRIVGLSGAVLIGLLLAAPWIIAETGLRDRLINTIMGTPNLTASTEAASLGWLSPLAIENVVIDGKLGRFTMEVESITAERSWPCLLATSPDLGTIAIEKPHVEVKLPLGERGTPSMLLTPSFTADANNAALTVRVEEVDEPIIDVDGIDMTLHVEEVGDHHMLTMAPAEIITKREVTPEICSRLLQLINPSLNDATHVEGEYSLTVDKLRIPIGIPEDQLV